ncbi:MAG: hypothetical protein QXK37_03865 [Candidatus Woesearchaeota archaeon]
MYYALEKQINRGAHPFLSVAEKLLGGSNALEEAVKSAMEIIKVSNTTKKIHSLEGNRDDGTPSYYHPFLIARRLKRQIKKGSFFHASTFRDALWLWGSSLALAYSHDWAEVLVKKGADYDSAIGWCRQHLVSSTGYAPTKHMIELLTPKSGQEIYSIDILTKEVLNGHLAPNEKILLILVASHDAYDGSLSYRHFKSPDKSLMRAMKASAKASFMEKANKLLIEKYSGMLSRVFDLDDYMKMVKEGVNRLKQKAEVHMAEYELYS